MFVFVAVFSATSNSTPEESNSGGSFTFLTVIVTIIESSTEVSELPSTFLSSVTCTVSFILATQ